LIIDINFSYFERIFLLRPSMVWKIPTRRLTEEIVIPTLLPISELLKKMPFL